MSGPKAPPGAAAHIGKAAGQSRRSDRAGPAEDLVSQIERDEGDHFHKGQLHEEVFLFPVSDLVGQDCQNLIVAV